MKVFVLDAWGRLADCKKPDDHIPPHQGRGGLLVINFLAIDFFSFGGLKARNGLPSSSFGQK